MTGPFTACKSDISNLEKLGAWRAELSLCMRVCDRQPQRSMRGVARYAGTQTHTHAYIHAHARVRSGAGVREG